MDRVAVLQREGACYCGKETLFRPDAAYPEYPFPSDVADGPNTAYDMIRQGFMMLKMDEEHAGQVSWNPLGEIVRPGDCVLIKPNMVLDRNQGDGGEECLYTHPSFAAAVIDYVWIALKGRGSIIIGDAPVQSCCFERLIEESGYKVLVDYYAGKGIDVALKDFRGLKSEKVHGVLRAQVGIEKSEDGVIVDLGKHSLHASLGEGEIDRFRITNYDPAELRRHHNYVKHEYLIAPDILRANVVINLPKPKTHRKSGVTIAMKNLVGINVRKEYLPHHRKGSSAEGGDEYLQKAALMAISTRLLDAMNAQQASRRYFPAKIAAYISRALSGIDKRFVHRNNRYREGSWYGNDTIWRTIWDLNRITIFADSSGKMQIAPQRRVFNIADMIVTGEKEGPMQPSPRNAGVVVMGYKTPAVDRVIATIMGFDIKKIPFLARDGSCDAYAVPDDTRTIIVSNNILWNQREHTQVAKEDSLHLIPSDGWKGHIER